MPVDLLQYATGKFRVDLDLVFPPFLERALAVLAECQRYGRNYYVVADFNGPNSGGGFRSWEAQDALFAQGRTRVYDAAGQQLRIVTDARGGYSAHNFGIAFDVCADADMTRAGLQPEWGNVAYDLLGDVCQRHDLVWGGSWARKDRPHFQLPGFVTGRELEILRAPVLRARSQKLSVKAQVQTAWSELYASTPS